jgi:hypothetical protein
MRVGDPSSFRLSARNGLAADMTWTVGVIVPPATAVDCVDLGWRMDIIVRRGTDEITVVGDQRTSERVVFGTAGSPLREFALELMERRLRTPRLGRASPDDAQSVMRLLAESTGAEWLPPLPGP